MNSNRHPDLVVGDSTIGGEAASEQQQQRSPLSAPCSPALDSRPEEADAPRAAAPAQQRPPAVALVPPDVVVRHLRQQQPQRQESMSSYEEVQRRILKRLASQHRQRWGQPPPQARAAAPVAMSTVTAASSSSDNDNGANEEDRPPLDDDECEDDLDSVASGGGYSASVSSSEGSEDHHHEHHHHHRHHHRHHIHGWSNPDHVEYGVRPGDDHSLSSIEEEPSPSTTVPPKFGFFIPHHQSRKRSRRQQTGGESSSELDSFSDGSNRLRNAAGGGIGGEIHVHGGFDFGSSSFTGSFSCSGSSSSCSTSSLLSGLSAHLPLLGSGVGSSEEQSTCSSSSSGTFAGATDGHKRRRLMCNSATATATATATGTSVAVPSAPPPRAVSTAPSPPPPPPQAVAVPARTYGGRRQQQQQAAGAPQQQQSQAASMAALSRNMSALQARMMQAAAQAQASRPRPQQQQQRKSQNGAMGNLAASLTKQQRPLSQQQVPSEEKQVQQQQQQAAQSNPACLTNGLALMERTFKSKMQQAAQQQQQRHQQVQSKMGRRLQCQVQALPPSSRRGRMVRQRSRVVTGNLKSNPEFYEDPTTAFDRTPIYHLGNDLVAHCVSFLGPIEVHTLLTAPLSKTFKEYYSDSSDLWKILCLKPPFFARLDGLKELTDYKNSRSSSKQSYKEFSSDESDACFSTDSHTELKHLFGQFRLLYTSFVRCMKYLDRIKADALSGKGKESSSFGSATSAAAPAGSPAVAVAAGSRPQSPQDADEASPGGFRFGLANGGTMDAPTSLADFLARARRVVNNKREERDRRQRRRTSLGDTSLSSDAEEEEESDEDYLGLGSPSSGLQTTPWPAAQQHHKSSKDGRAHGSGGGAHSSNRFAGEKKTKLGHSKLTQRLLGPSKTGEAGHVDLPWSCAIYAIVNWMVAFADVQGIQVMCLRVLPYLLEDERQRTTAQLAGLTSIVVRAMVLFPDSVELHTAAFHTLVLLARPLGGREGMLFHRTMVGSTCGIFEVPVGGSHQQSAAANGRATTNGTAVILDSMRRHSSSEVLQAMSCWSMVNIALIPTQKAMLVKLGGIEATANAMVNHPYSAEVQFRALFALINLVIPCDGSSINNGDGDEGQERHAQDGGGDAIANYATEREMLDENVARIANLVVVAMKNFCSNEAILNRACLVLHNLSLNADYHTTLLWTPNCYQMLQWTMANYPHDKVVEQSAGGTLQRLQVTLRDNDDLRSRFAASLRAQQQQQQQALLMQQQQQSQPAAIAQQQAVLQQQH